MTPLRKRMIEDLQIRNYSPRTVKTYTHHVASFAKYFGRSPEELGPEEIRQYQVYLVQEKQASWSGFNQAVCALRFLYGTTLSRPWPVTMIPYGKRPKTLPAVLGPEEVQKLLACADPLKHRVILSVLYAAGLRLDEALHLKLSDVDSARMLLRIACGKGAKERLVPLSPRLLETLREYWRTYRPSSWLFPGTKNPEQPAHASMVQKCCRRAACQAGLSKHVTPHTLRHSYATGLLEAGVDLLTIGRLLGHRSFSSTLIYLHVRRPHLISTPSPLDWLPVQQWPQTESPLATQSPQSAPEGNSSNGDATPRTPATKKDTRRKR